MATEVAQLIFKADTSQLKTAEAQVEKLGKTTQNTDRKAAQFGRTAGMAGIQFEQLSGQIAGGQNVMRAIGAQASDLGFVLGVPLLGAVVGISAALASMIPTLNSAENEIKEMADSVLGLETNLNSLTQAQRAAVAAEFTKDINKLNKEISGTGGLNTYLGIATEKLGRLQATFDAGTYILPNGAITSQQEYEKVISKTQEEVNNLQSQIDLKNSAIKRMNDVLDGSVGSTNDLITALREEVIVLGMSARQKAIYNALSEGATAEQIKEINLIYDGIEAKNKDMQAEKTRADAAEKTEQARARSAEKFKAQSAAASENARQLAMLQLSEEDRESKRFENQIIKLQEQKQKQLITEQEYSDALQGIVAQRASRLTEIELSEEERKQRLLADQRDKDEAIRQELREKELNAAAFETDKLLEFEDQLLKGKSESTKAAYRIGVNFANEERRENARKIISSSYTAAMGAYESLAPIPIVGPALGAAAAGTILAAGVSFAAKSLAGRALGGQVRPGESYVVGERGPEVLTMGNTVGKITTNESLRNSGQQGAGGGNIANVSFNINANDTKGFDRLLDSRRGQIVNMINQALNENGKMGLV